MTIKKKTTKKKAPRTTPEPMKVVMRKKAMLEALRKNLGIVQAACKMVGISRWLHYDWLNNDPEYKKEVEGITEDAIDFAEGKLLQKINTGDTVATIFFLKTKGKSRGYIERTETDANVNLNPAPIIIDWNAPEAQG